jgi:hypothetical protein
MRPSGTTPPQNALQPSNGLPEAASSPAIAITCVEGTPVRVKGLATGRSYEFSAAQPVQEVDTQDASALLTTRYFRRA